MVAPFPLMSINTLCTGTLATMPIVALRLIGFSFYVDQPGVRIVSLRVGTISLTVSSSGGFPLEPDKLLIWRLGPRERVTLYPGVLAQIDCHVSAGKPAIVSASMFGHLA